VTKPFSPRWQGRGYILTLVLAIGVVITIGIGTMLMYLSSANRTTGRLKANRGCFYAVDGANRDISRLLVDELGKRDSSKVLGSDLKETLQVHFGYGGYGGIMVPGYRIPDFAADVDVSDAAAELAGSVPSGLLEGLSGFRREFRFALRVERVATRNVCEASQAIEALRVPISNFAYFASQNAEIQPRLATSFTIPTGNSSSSVSSVAYVNGDLCGNTRTRLPRTLLTGSVTTACSGEAPVFRHCVDSSCSADLLVAAAKSRVQTNLKGQPPLLADIANVVPKLLFAFDPPVARVGRDAEGATVSNDGTMRFMMDPPRALENEEARRKRIGARADIRIIDGVVYLKNLADPEAWPGIKVHSDHRGIVPANRTGNEAGLILGSNEDLGHDPAIQIDGTNWSAYDNATPGIISYGAIVPAPGLPGRYLPAYRPVDVTPASCTTGADAVLQPYTVASSCVVGSELSRLRAGAGTGFVDLARGNSKDRNGVAFDRRILPINIDLDALAAALSANAPLRARFSTDELSIYVTSTWSGSMNGVGNAALPSEAVLGPATALSGVPNDAVRTGDGQVVPAMPLCSEASEADSAEVDLPACSATSNALRINAVRVLPVSNTSGRDASRRLTIATDLPLYIVADQFDNVTNRGNPIEVIADSLTILPNNWSDANAQWSTNTPLPAAAATAPVRLFGSFMVGALPSTASRYGGGAERALRAMVPGLRVQLFGSLAQPFTAVFSGPPGVLASDTSGTTFEWPSILNVAVTRTTPTILLFAPGVSVPDRRRLCGYGGFNSYGGYGGYGGGYGGCG
jgi:hypothetical protein